MSLILKNIDKLKYYAKIVRKLTLYKISENYIMSGLFFLQKGGRILKQNDIGCEVKALNNLIKRRVELSEIKREVDNMTGVHSFIIGYIAGNSDKDIFQRDIEEKFGIRRSTATGIINRMEKNGLVVRNKVDYDARLKKLVLTDKAREINKLVEEDIGNIEKIIIDGIEEEELETFRRVMKKMKDNLNSDMEKKGGIYNA